MESLISERQELLKHLSDPGAYAEAMKEIEGLQAQIDAITGEGQTDPAEAARQAEEERKREIERILQDYASEYDRRIMLFNQYSADIKLLEEQKNQATTDAEKQQIDRTIAYRRKKYDEDRANLLASGLEATKNLIAVRKNAAIMNISRQVFMWETDRNKAILEEEKRAAMATLAELRRLYADVPTDEIAAEIADITQEVEYLNAELERMSRSYFDVWTADDASSNDSPFMFEVVGTYDWRAPTSTTRAASAAVMSAGAPVLLMEDLSVAPAEADGGASAATATVLEEGDDGTISASFKIRRDGDA